MSFPSSLLYPSGRRASSERGLRSQTEQGTKQDNAVRSKSTNFAGNARGTPGKDQPSQPSPKASLDSAKLEQQLSDKEHQIQGPEAQLESAGLKPEFKHGNSSERGRPSPPKGCKKGKGKGKKKMKAEQSRLRKLIRPELVKICLM